MKIKSLHTMAVIVSKGYGSTFSHTNHHLMFNKEMGGFFIDGTTFVPMNNVTEVVFDSEEVENIVIKQIKPKEKVKEAA